MADNFSLLSKENNILKEAMKQKRAQQTAARRSIILQQLSNASNDTGKLDFRAADENGVLRMIMSAIDLFDEFGIHAHFAGFDASGNAQFYVNADDGKLLAGAGAVVLDSNGISVVSVDAKANQRSYKFVDSVASVLSGMYSYITAASNFLSIELEAITGKGSSFSVLSQAPSSKQATISFATYVNGTLKGALAILDDVVKITAGRFTANENQNDADTVIRGVGDANLIYVDASADKVGVGTATPAYKLDVAGDVNVTGTLRKNGVDVTTSTTNPVVVVAVGPKVNISTSGQTTVLSYTLPAGLLRDSGYFNFEFYVYVDTNANARTLTARLVCGATTVSNAISLGSNSTTGYKFFGSVAKFATDQQKALIGWTNNAGGAELAGMGTTPAESEAGTIAVSVTLELSGSVDAGWFMSTLGEKYTTV